MYWSCGTGGRNFPLLVFQLCDCLVVNQSGLYHFAFPPAMNESSYCSAFSPEIGVVIVWDFNNSNKCVVVSHFIIILIFSTLNDIWCLNIFSFAYLLSKCFLWLGLALLPIFKLSLFLLLSFKNYFVYFGYQYFVRCMLCSDFSPSV